VSRWLEPDREHLAGVHELQPEKHRKTDEEFRALLAAERAELASS
jgi:hypothetical protein